jgi:hypothetical protein
VDAEFKTTAPPATVKTEPASSVSQTSATLNATVNPNGSNVSDCKFEYGTTTSYGSSAPCAQTVGSGTSNVAVSAAVSSLTANTAYHFRISATNAGGTITGADQTLKTASPAPEFGRCVKVPAGAGAYANAACTQLGGARTYEWFPGVVKRTFTTAIAEGEATFETVKGTKLTCKGQLGTGEYTGPKTVASVVLTFSACEMLGQKCSTAGAAEGQIESKSLEGVLGVISSAEISSKTKIGLELFPAGNTGVFMEFSCAGAEGWIRGAVIVPVTSKIMQKTTRLSFSARKGKQKPESFQSQPKNILEASFGLSPVEQLGLTLTMNQTSQERVEVNSVV